MKSIILTLLASLSLVVACGQSKPSKLEEVKTDKMEITETDFKPDRSINRQIYLQNPSSTIKVLGDIMPLIDADEDLPYTYFESQNGEEYLQVIFFPGNEANSISQFTVGYSVDLSNSEKLNPVQLTAFHTESGIKLGMSKQELTLIKGDGYSEEEVNGLQAINYEISDNTSAFLSRYNMPFYIAEYSFKNGSLVKYKFGFEYP